jgi:hypothetical protein
MKKLFCALMVMTAVFGGGKVHAQFKDNYWVFGDSAGINWSNPSNPTMFKSKVRGRGSCVSLADSSGLLIYSHSNYTTALFNQSQTYNRHNEPIPESDSLYVEAWYHEMVLIPHPGNDSLVYLFTIGVNSFDGLYYTLINYKANNDSGVVIQKNVIVQQVPAFDGLTAVRHGNGRDWWLLFKKWDGTGQTGNNLTYCYLINPNGIDTSLIQSIGPFFTTGGGHLISNLNGSKLVHIDWRGLILLFNFDRCTGLFSMPITIEAERSGNPYPYYISAAFSPDDSKLYVISVAYLNQPGQNDTLFQFDLTAPNIFSSKQVIAVLPSYELGAGNMRLAPDNRIYLTSTDEIASIPYPDSLFTTINTHLSVINYPDSLGSACDFQPYSFYLGGARTYYGLPNNPDYELGAWVGSPCDTLSVGLDENVPEQEVFFQAWFNSESNMIHVNASKLKGRTGSLRLFDMEGRLVYEKKIEVISGGYVTGEIPMNAVANGVYLVNLITDSESVSSKVVKF